MKYCSVLLLVFLTLNCPKKYAPRLSKIEVVYVSSLYDDVYREPPLLAGTEKRGITLGHMITDKPYIPYLFEKLGFQDLVNECTIDFIIGDSILHTTRALPIRQSMGYGIKNVGGIRFAVLSKDKDTLTIDDRVTLSLVEQRSDVLWIIDHKLLALPPVKINFLVKGRTLSDTTMENITTVPDTTLLRTLRDFRNVLDSVLNIRYDVGRMYPWDFILMHTARAQGVNAICYPKDMFTYRYVLESATDSMTVQELFALVRRNEKFKKISAMSDIEVRTLQSEKNYNVWGDLAAKNAVLVPDTQGQSLFDICPLMEVSR